MGLTAPIDQILLPALLWIDGTALVAGIVWLPLVLLVVIVAASSPLIRRAGVGSHSLLRRGRDGPRALDRAGVRHSPLPQLPPRSAVHPRRDRGGVDPRSGHPAASRAPHGRLPGRHRRPRRPVRRDRTGRRGLPREAHRDAAEVIARGSPTTPVLAYMRNPGNLVFYLKRPVEDLEAEDVADTRLQPREPGLLRHAAVRPRGRVGSLPEPPRRAALSIPSVHAR